MGFKSKILAIAVATCFGFATTASAATLASAYVDANYEIETSATTGASTFSVDGDFGGLLNFNHLPNGDAIYTLTASRSLDGAATLVDSVSALLTLDDFEDALFIGFVLADIVASNAGSMISFPGGLGGFTYDFTNVVTSSTPTTDTIDGEFSLTGGTTVPIGPLVDSTIDDILTDLGLSVPALSGFSFPNNASGDFVLDLTLNIAPVPLPAGGLLLVSGLALMAVKRRKKAA